MQINALEECPASISGLCSLTGSEFTQLAPTEQASAVARLSVFARVEPSHKSNLVTRLKEQAGSPSFPQRYARLCRSHYTLPGVVMSHRPRPQLSVCSVSTLSEML